jgi:hypothetical protein
MRGARRHASARHPVPGIQPGDLVGFGQRRIVERILVEVIDAAFEVERGLADIDQFGGAWSNRAKTPGKCLPRR